jgi:acetyl esterase
LSSTPIGERPAPGGIPVEIELRIRSRGAALDMNFTQSIYKDLMDSQRRDGVQVARELAYGPDPRHRLDVYRPQNTGAKDLPVLIFMHGGGFIRGDKSDRENTGQYFARQGMVVILPNYRLAPAHTWPSGPQDVIAAHQWAHRHAADFGGDAQRIVLAGESAGAAHVAAATLIRHFRPPDGLAIAGVALISGAYDVRLEWMARAQFGIATPDPRNDAYFGTDSARYAEMSTVELIDAQPMPMLISYAELDMPQMQVQAGELFARLVTRHGFSPTLSVIRGHNHLTQLYSVNTGDESLSGPLLEFLRGCGCEGHAPGKEPDSSCGP